MSQIFNGKEGIIAQWKNAIKIRSRAIPDIWNYDFFQNNKDWFTYSINEFKNSLTDKVSYLLLLVPKKLIYEMQQNKFLLIKIILIIIIQLMIFEKKLIMKMVLMFMLWIYKKLIKH
ncbi:hypothetical protein [Spiroplasma phoeniceum]|uniref:Uncharacterized protein n=1 Tax=Spiroplasma phoeniceum P40 TaxID=1276259 RepID=A0A345DQ40_9MOLU|nr:hypothetical protein [Spiroplasma phoeniceum]AXF96328.1 hypothetical protein SDAV_001361 [Spiroplasma phoeniceum P40]